LGLKINVGRLLTVDWAPHPDQGDKLLLVFDCGRLNNHQIASINYRDGEIAEHAFLHVIEVEDKAMPRLRRRVRASLIVLANERFAYLEHGDVPTRTDRQRVGCPSGPGIA